MSKKMLWGATLPGCLLLALVWTMLALCGNSLANPPDGDGNHNHGGGGGGGGKIPVTVTFRDFLGDGLKSDCHDCQTTCDCLSPYIAGAVITTLGNFRMGLGSKGNQPVIRTLFFDFSDCIEGPCEPPFEDGFSVGSVNMFTSGSGIDLREMLVGEVRDDLSLIMGLNLDSVENGLWRIFFDPLNDRCEGSTFITVRRVAADTWEIEAGLTDVACLVEVVGGGEFIFSGSYHMPFKITIKIK